MTTYNYNYSYEIFIAFYMIITSPQTKIVCISEIRIIGKRYFSLSELDILPKNYVNKYSLIYN